MCVVTVNPAGRSASASLMCAMYRSCRCSASSPRPATIARCSGPFRYARLVSSNCRYVQPSPANRPTSSRYAATKSDQNASESAYTAGSIAAAPPR